MARTGDFVSSSDPAYELSGDQPIEALAEDRLGRRGFVELLVDEIRSSPRSGLVVGVTGPWGSGKTSAVNMAVSALDGDVGFRVLHFNPWLFAGTPQLVDHFFAELAAQLREAGTRRKGERLSKLGDTLAGYAMVLDPLRFVPGMDALVGATRSGAGILRRAGATPASAREKKASLDALLQDHDERLVVVIDDIDRLERSEIRDVMRLVRLVGDFPNTVYLLAYAQELVARALTDEFSSDADQDSDGYEYLEKIVQVSHAVPTIDADTLSGLVLARMEEATEGLEFTIDPEHWGAVYSSIRNYFQTMRDVLRFSNAVRGPVRRLIEEIDVADVLGLEALRVFEPQVWRAIASLARPLTTPRDSYALDSERTAAEERLRGLPDQARDKAAVTALLCALFPSVSSLFRSALFGGGSWPSDARRKGRVGHYDILRIYLERQVAEDQASRVLTQSAAEQLMNPSELRTLLADVDDAQLPSLLSRLQEYEVDLPIGAVAAIPVFLELIPRLPPRRPGLSDIEPEIRIARVTYRLVRGRSSEELAAAIPPILSELQSLSDRVHVLRMLGWEAEARELLVDTKTVAEWAEAIAAEAGARAASALALEHDLADVVRVVRRTNGEDGLRDWAKSRVGSPAFLVALFGVYNTQIQNSAGRHIVLGWDSLSELVGADQLISSVESLPTEEAWHSALDDDQQELVAQARRFAADPVVAVEIMREHRRRYS